MRFGSVCSGIEAASVAWRPLGWEAAWLSEIEPFPCAVLAHHYPDVPNLGDMTALPERIASGEVEAPDVFCGGTPCQAFSVAGLRQSLDDARGNLSLVFCEIANAIDSVRVVRGQLPAIVFWENVPGVLSTKDNAFGCFLAGLAGENDPLEPPGGKWTNAGCVFGPQRTVAWRVLDAQYFGVAQRRRRVFVVASARKGFDPATVLFEFDGVRRDSAPSREARQTAPTIPARSSAGGGLGTDFDCDGGVIQAYGGNNQSGPIDVATARNACASASGRMDFETETFLVAPVATAIRTANTSANGHGISDELAHTLDGAQGQCVAFDTTHTLRGEGFDASEDGTGRGTPLVPVTTPTLTSNGDANKKFRDEHGLVPVAYGIRTAHTSANGWGVQEEVTHTLDCAQGVAVAVALRGREGGATAELGDEVQNCLRASSGGGDKPHVLTAMQVRRLTPTEAERLMGFPDGYTAIPWRKKPASECPDGPRYKSLGNSWAVPNVHWIGERIAAAVTQRCA